MGIKGHQISISLYGTYMGIKGHQSSISLATVQTWVLKDTKDMGINVSLATVQTWVLKDSNISLQNRVLKDTKSVYH